MNDTSPPDKPVLILYFARLGEQLGCREESLILPETVATTGQLRDYLVGRGDSWKPLQDGTIRVAVNQDITDADAAVEAGDEVAFFPPVTGG